MILEWRSVWVLENNLVLGRLGVTHILLLQEEDVVVLLQETPSFLSLFLWPSLKT